MEKRKMCDFLLSIMFLLMFCTSAAAASLEPPTPESSAQTETSDLFTFADYCAEVGASQHMQQWLSAVADMEKELIFYRWGLDERIRFVTAMHKAAYTMDPTLYAILTDDTLDADIRVTAADQIIDFYYGSVIGYVDPVYGPIKSYDFERRCAVAGAIGEAPPQIVLFKEAYDREFPNVPEQDFIDAFAYWRRDIDRVTFVPMVNDDPLLYLSFDWAVAAALVRQELKMAFPWASEIAIDTAAIEFVEETNILNFEADFPNSWIIIEAIASLGKENVFPVPNAEIQANLESHLKNGLIQDIGTAYQVHMQIGPYFNNNTLDGVSMNDESAEMDAQAVRTPIIDATASKDSKIGVNAIRSQFGLSTKETDRYFTCIYPLSSRSTINIVLLYPHYSIKVVNWAYGAVINLETGDVLDCFTLDMLQTRLPLIPADPNATSSSNLWWCPYAYLQD